LPDGAASWCPGWEQSTASGPAARRARIVFLRGSAVPTPASAAVLLVGNLLHPLDGLPVKLFLNGDVRHGRGWRGPVPVLLTRRNPDHVARPNLLDRPTPVLGAPAAGRHDQGLPQGMRVPRGARAGLERDAGADRACRGW